ncbi:flagellar export chaperone FliS [Desulfoscipio gibsoniae]|uniref:Flagellar secretion chaperone FliS n=1 Tax=Desulfoscipio gibsoniae DSM 7213 TaxID=767817 RepID=R4KMA9_9FIRM|nr:flagellar export chaperone FliS [Desulfoscipio gibsoniae]AGL01665.1 flagellar biosynthetic protein FliS [Desulfoscipio gibsoniae DSM 7213]
MALNNPYQRYQQNSVSSAPPQELTNMLYSGGVRFIRQAMQSIEENEMEKAHQELVRAQEIYKHLQDTLNMDIKISNNLYNLYDFMIRQLLQANIKKDIAILHEILGLAEELRNTWKEAMVKARGQV